jgi:hypothetical protein
MGAITVHTPREGRAPIDTALEMPHPTIQAIIMPTDIVIKTHVLRAANLTHPYDSTIEIERTLQGRLETYLLQMFSIVVVVLLLQIILIPLKLPQQHQTPPLVEP